MKHKEFENKIFKYLDWLSTSDEEEAKYDEQINYWLNKNIYLVLGLLFVLSIFGLTYLFSFLSAIIVMVLLTIGFYVYYLKIKYLKHRENLNFQKINQICFTPNRSLYEKYKKEGDISCTYSEFNDFLNNEAKLDWSGKYNGKVNYKQLYNLIDDLMELPLREVTTENIVRFICDNIMFGGEKPKARRVANNFSKWRNL